jgi:hypothetical protein
VLYKDFGKFAERLSKRVKEHAKQFAERHGRPWIYLQSSSVSKEDVARRVMQRDGIQQGLVCVLRCVEPCQSFEMRKNREHKQLSGSAQMPASA